MTQYLPLISANNTWKEQVGEYGKELEQIVNIRTTFPSGPNVFLLKDEDETIGIYSFSSDVVSVRAKNCAVHRQEDRFSVTPFTNPNRTYTIYMKALPTGRD